MEFVADFKKGDEASVNCCRFSQGNGMIATGGDDCIVRLFKLPNLNNDNGIKGDNLQPVLTLEGHFEPVNCIDISHDGKMLISSSIDCSCLISNIDPNSKQYG